MALEPDPSLPSSEPPLLEAGSGAEISFTLSIAPTDSSPSQNTLVTPEPTRSRALSASRHPLPSSTPVFLTPPPENPVMIEVTWLPMPLKNNYFILFELEKKKAIELCGNALADISKDDFIVSAKGDYVETKKNGIALALKKGYDHMYGVGKNGVISPYTISSGRGADDQPVYRISYREHTSCSTSISSSSSSAPNTRPSSSRRSVTHFMPSVFSSITPSSQLELSSSINSSHSNANSSASNFYSSISNGTGSGSSSWYPAGSIRKKKLQRKRSAHISPSGNATNASMNNSPASVTNSGTGTMSSRSRSNTAGSYRSHSHSISTTEDSTGTGIGGRDRDHRVPIRLYGNAGNETDLLAELLSWDPRVHSQKSSGGSHGHRQTQGIRNYSGESNDDGERERVGVPRLPPHLTVQPFGEDVGFVVPKQPPVVMRTLAGAIRKEHTLRPMNSFDSNLTARATDPEGSAPPSDPDSESDSKEREDATIQFRTSKVLATKYQTGIFSILQSLTGIRDRLPSSSTDSSVFSNEVTPEDDPRFVLWGTHLSSSSSDSTSTIDNHGHGRLPQARERMIIAASIERWVAQLTSVLDYDELLNFYLTFRTFISPVDLCRLLICRFQWSLISSESASSLVVPVSLSSGGRGRGSGSGAPHSVDASVRRIVRLRTFVAIKYWIQTFFAVDFLPNRELRMMFAEWLNSAGEDPNIAGYPDALIIIEKLRKITRACRDMHLKKSIYRKENSAPVAATQSQPHLPLSDGTGNIEGSSNSPPGLNQEDDNRVDLDLEKHGDMHAAASNVHNRLDLAATIAPASLTPNKSASSDAVMLQQSIIQKILTSAQNPAASMAIIPTSSDGTIHHNALPQHSAISRAFFSAFGRLGRWRRELTSRSRNNPTSLACMAGFDPEDGNPYRQGDLLGNKEGLNAYLRERKIEIGSESKVDGKQVSSPEGGPPGTNNTEDYVLDIAPGLISNASGGERTLAADAVPVGVDESEHLQDDESSVRASVPSAALSLRPHPEVVSLDDYEFSDSDASGYGEELPPGLRPVKRLPLRRDIERDFELIGRESVSSLGGSSRLSIPTGGIDVNGNGIRDSIASDDSMPAGPGGVQYWQLQIMLDAQRSDESDEEPGDVNAALRRLEGQIDASQQRVKENQVEGWLKTVARKERDGGYEDDIMEPETGSETEPITPAEEMALETDPSTGTIPSVLAMTPSQSDLSTVLDMNPPDGKIIAVASRDSKEKKVLANHYSTVQHPVPVLQPLSRFASPASLRPQIHRSFVLLYSSDQLAKQWCLIDRDFFLAVKFEELTFEDQSWKQLKVHDDVTDWSLFMKERMKMKLEASVNPEVKMPTSITTSRLRFNMMVNFVVSEIVLSEPFERMNVVSKFIRIAWKSYTLNNYHAVVAIMMGLQTRWVVQAVGKMGSKLGMWESRLFADLQYFTSPHNDFQLIRQSVASFPPSVTGKETIDDGHNPGQLAACVPFVGMYLSQLFKHNQLPQYIDPSSPLDPVAPDATQEDLCRPEVFSHLKPIPPFMSVGSLLNVHKQRLLATVIKSLVAGQHLASRVNFQVDQKLYWKCMRLKCLNPEALEQLSSHRDA